MEDIDIGTADASFVYAEAWDIDFTISGKVDKTLSLNGPFLNLNAQNDLKVQFHDFITDEITDSYALFQALNGELMVYDSSFTCDPLLSLTDIMTQISTSPTPS